MLKCIPVGSFLFVVSVFCFGNTNLFASPVDTVQIFINTVMYWFL